MGLCIARAAALITTVQKPSTRHQIIINNGVNTAEGDGVMESSSSNGQHIYPYKLRPQHPEAAARVASAFRAYPRGLLSANHFDFKLAATVSEQELQEAYNYPLDPRDVWIVSPPKCGNTWTQEMVWLLANDLDYQGAQCPLMPDRWNFLDWDLFRDGRYIQELVAKLMAENPALSKPQKLLVGDPNRPSPKFVKSHLPLSMNNPDLLDTCKVFYVARNPKDTCLSYYKHCRLSNSFDFEGDLEQFADMFMRGEVVETPLIPSIVEAWNLRCHPNLCLIFYEDLQRDLRGQLNRMASHLGKTYSDEEINKLAEHLHIDNFRKSPHLNLERLKQVGMFKTTEGTFIRKGITGDWKNHFTPELNDKFDAWMSNQLEGTDLTFVTTL